MDTAQLNGLANFIWNIADDVLRDLYVRGKYRDVILPMTVLRRLDAVLEPTKQAVLDMKATLDKARHRQPGRRPPRTPPVRPSTTPRPSRCAISSPAPASSSSRTTSRPTSMASRPMCRTSSTTSSSATRSRACPRPTPSASSSRNSSTRTINLSPKPVERRRLGTHPGLDNHAMGTIFEELVRRFNEENNEEAGEHWTPRDAVQAHGQPDLPAGRRPIQSGTYLLYDGACGTGGMLTVAEETLQADRQGARQAGRHPSLRPGDQRRDLRHLQSRPPAQGRRRSRGQHRRRPEHSTLSNDAFRSREFDFMLSNPPYGKSWKSDLERMGGKEGHAKTRASSSSTRGDPEYSLVTRSSDGQMLFLANMLRKMKHDTPLGSRIAEVHNGSSLFTGDAGQGESNIRRWIIENDWLEAIVALPLNMFYNTGIATYIWVLTNRKPEHRRGKVQLIDATQWFKPLRKNLGKKNCELAADDIQTHLRYLPRLRGDASSRRSSPTPPSATGRSRSSAPSACTASSRRKAIEILALRLWR